MTEVAAALIWDSDRFMVCRRPENKARGGLWEFVGGKVEPGESGEQALARECMEELAVEVSVGDVYMELVHEYPDLTVHLTLYNAAITRGEPRLIEHSDLRWITPQESDGYEFCPADGVILERLKAESKPILALMYDFDHTLSPGDMQEYGFIPGLGMDADSFWAECNKTMRRNGMDQILAYMLLMLEKSKGKQLVTHDILQELGKKVKLFPGVKTWFNRVNAYAEKNGLRPEHYIISSGLKEIIQGTQISKEFKEIYAASFCYDANGVPYWPAMAVNYTSKTQFLFRINKGVLDVTDNRGLNEYMPEDKRRVPFRNMIYVGDGLTDVPCMKLTKVNGGHSIAVFQDDRGEADDMIRHGRVDFVIKADYSRGSEMEQAVFEIIDKVAATAKTVKRHMLHSEAAEAACVSATERR